jgi:DNA-directed RNA polymerase subunit RPC12/RpoP
MNVTFSCPACNASVAVELDPQASEIACPACGARLAVPAGAVSAGQIHRCVVCPSTELFVRKDFPQRLGVAIVVIGFAASCISWGFYHVYLTFGILFATALIDVLLYVVVGDNLTCYRCHAQYRGVEHMQDHGAFELETHERYRQQAARLGSSPGNPQATGSAHAGNPHPGGG